MKHIFTFSILLLLMTSCKKIATDELLQNRVAGAPATAALTTGAYRWIKMTVPPFTGTHSFKPERDNVITPVGRDIFCVGGLDHLGDWYKFNSSTKQWALQSFSNIWFGSTTYPGWQCAFSYGSKIFTGLGYSGLEPYYVSDYFVSADPVAGIQTALPRFPGTPSLYFTSFVIGDKGYILGGYNALLNDCSNQFWEYNFSTNQWTNKGVSPLGKRSDALVIVYGGKAYMGLGYDFVTINGQRITRYKNDWIEYDPASSFHRILADLPGQKRAKAKGFIIERNIYAGFGYNGSGGLNDFWKYDPAANAWTQQATYTGSAVTNRVNTNAFSVNGEGYVVKGDLSECYRFTNSPF